MEWETVDERDLNPTAMLINDFICMILLTRVLNTQPDFISNSEKTHVYNRPPPTQGSLAWLSEYSSISRYKSWVRSEKPFGY